jgi:hypothetical protein
MTFDLILFGVKNDLSTDALVVEIFKNLTNLINAITHVVRVFEFLRQFFKLVKLFVSLIFNPHQFISKQSMASKGKFTFMFAALQPGES